jgi:hypothetical protein
MKHTYRPAQNVQHKADVLIVGAGMAQNWGVGAVVLEPCARNRGASPLAWQAKKRILFLVNPNIFAVCKGEETWIISYRD